MKVLWLAWKDAGHPASGGAEVVLHELMERQVRDGDDVTLLTALYPGALATEQLDSGILVIRVGTNRYSHPLQALMYYLQHLRGQYDLIIETVNTMPYFGLLFRGRSRGVALYHQLARHIWFFETKGPLSHVGYYIIEPFSTWLLGKARAPLITVSESTKQDLLRFGWDKQRAHVISEGIRLSPLEKLSAAKKYRQPTMLSLGSVRAMKRTLDQVKAFELAKAVLPELQMIVAGDTSDAYGRRVLDYIQGSPYATDITVLGRVSEQQKQELMQRCHVICVTSVKEGWGLIVTEAASQGTPAVVYDVDGLRDSVRSGETGIVTEPNPKALATGVMSLLGNAARYQKMRTRAWEWSKEITFDRSFQDFKQVLKEAL